MSNRILLFLLFSLFAFSYCFDKEKVLKEKLGDMTDDEILERLGVSPDQGMTFWESIIDYTNGLFNDDYNNCAVRKDFDIPDIFMFAPILKGKLFKPGDKISFSNYCFQKSTVELIGYEGGKVRLEITTSNPAKAKCKDTYLFHTASYLTPKIIVQTGTFNLDLIIDSELYTVLQTQGLRVFSLCESLVDTARSIIATYYFIMGGDTLDENGRHQTILTTNKISDSKHEEECLKFHEKYTGERPQLRVGHETDVLDVEKYIKSGDFLGLNVITGGESCLINYITGGAISHAAIAIRREGKLGVLESTDGGIRFMPWDEFIQDCIKTNHTLMWFPLSEENSKKFDTEKAYAWFKERLGVRINYFKKYSFHTE
ncbi:MAG: hypothetical protein MJ252_26510 [archaeon]|nr:hypothetical protein [archaeon]